MTRVVVTGVGALSALGTTPAALWAALCAGRRGVRTIRGVDNLEITCGGAIEHPDPAVPAIDAALGQARRDAADTGFFWGTGLDHHARLPPGHRTAGDAFAALAHRFAAPRRMIAVACATGTAAIGEAFRAIRAGRVEACVAGGSSTMLGAFYLIGFHALRAVAIDVAGEDASTACKPFDRRRRGFALADGAGALVLESLESARRRGAEPLAEIAGYGVSQDAFDLNRPPADGAGALLAMQRALADGQIANVDAINAHGTGTPAGDVAEAAAIRRLFPEAWPRVPVSSIKGAIGHAMAAAGALEAIAAIETCRTGLVPQTVNLEEPDEACALDHVIGAPRDAGAARVLSVSFGMGGQNAAIVISRFAS
jgi:3-oxoacyl-[acyl-carrier-protein] synthase II